MRKIIFLFLSIWLVSSAYANIPTQMLNKQQPSLSTMLKTVMPTVVNIKAVGELPSLGSLLPPQYQQKLPPQDLETNPKFHSMGSGVVVNAQKGYILTNAHVVKNAHSITVTLNDSRVFDAKLVGLDAPSDIAVLQIPAKNLVAIQLGNSSKLEVGDFVVAIGSPFGLKQSVTSGIVSALGRADLHIEGYEDFIQTDASINPGNSGGALVDLEGKLIGINTAILAPSGGNIGIGFAIPSNMAESVMEQLVTYGKVRRGLVGVIVQDLTPALATAFGTPQTKGAIITQVNSGTPAEDAGLKVGDIILKINQKDINDASQVRNMIGLLRAGSDVSLEISRDGKIINLKPATADPQSQQRRTIASNPYLFGLALRDFSAELPSQGEVKGVQVMQVEPQSSAARATPHALTPGDIIVSVNQHPVQTMEQLKKIALNSKDHLLLRVITEAGALFVVMTP